MAQNSVLISDHLDRFASYIREEENLARSTAFHYRRDVSLFMRYFGRQFNVDPAMVRYTDVTTEDILSFLEYLRKHCHNGVDSIRRRLAAIRSFFRYIDSLAVDQLDPNPAAALVLPHIPASLPKTLTRQDCTKLLQAVRTYGPNPIRDYAIFRLLLQCGASLSEVTNLHLKDVDVEEGFICLDRDGNRERYLPLSQKTTDALYAYLRIRPTVYYPQVFINRLYKPITPVSVNHAINKCVSVIPLSAKKVTAKIMQDTCFTLMAEEGFTVDELQEISGIRSKRTVQKYLLLAQQKAEKVSLAQ